ncbi:MAG TPA: hypothetical protein VJV23_00870 [Candidatus Polarisedimenticolia bacterium]|nr:hypothetical protein [Candidatus Polarisedimenticolia bacterium]
MDRIHQDMGRHTLEEMAAELPQGLGVLRRLIEALDREGIRYLHWKSNEHLLEGMVGMTDLDVLFDRSAALRIDRIFAEIGYRRFLATPFRGYPGLEDYLGFDESTGNLVHIHVHHQLRMGEKNAKGFWPPWEELFLSTRHVQRPEGMWATHPDVEMIIFLLRAAMKARLRDAVLRMAGADYMRGDLDREYDWLRARVDAARVVDLTDRLLGPRAAATAREILTVRPTLRSLMRFRRRSMTMLKHCRTHNPLVSRLRRWFREAYGLRAAVGRRYTHPPRPMNRTVPAGGVMVAFIGSDGSGKSSVAGEIAHWLSWKVDTYKVYHGSGDGPSSFFRWPLRMALRAMGAGGGRRPAAAAGGPVEGRRPASHRMARRLRPVWALVLSMEKRRKLKKAWRARSRGMIVVCDRYPQNQVMGYNDGPLLAGWSDHRLGLLRALSRWEGWPYALAERYPPDLVVKMNVSPPVAVRRKPDMHEAEVVRRIETIRSLRFPASRVAEIDADQPLEHVVLEVKRHVWSVL